MNKIFKIDKLKKVNTNSQRGVKQETKINKKIMYLCKSKINKFKMIKTFFKNLKIFNMKKNLAILKKMKILIDFLLFQIQIKNSSLQEPMTLKLTALISRQTIDLK